MYKMSEKTFIRKYARTYMKKIVKPYSKAQKNTWSVLSNGV